MKTYVFLTFPIQNVGGGQCYVAAKAKYLESQGWKVFVMSGGNPKSKKKCPIDYLEKYRSYILPEIDLPLFKLPKLVVNIIVNKMYKNLRKSINNEIIIESHNDTTAFWGELLAIKTGARHIVFPLAEKFRLPNKTYDQKIDFFNFKFDRGEMLCTCLSANRLFEGFRSFKESDIESVCIDEAPVQDVKSKAVDSLEQLDYNICYLGRTHKTYVPNIIKGVGEFAANHPDSKIQLILVGDSSKQKELIDMIVSENSNLVFTDMGCLHPLPRALFGKIDVMIAGSGSARCSVEEGTLTIIAGSENNMSLGILGYDTNDSIYQVDDSVVTSFSEALERVLIRKVYKDMTFKYPRKMNVEECTKQNFKLINKAEKKLVYYDESKLREGKTDVKMTLRLIINKVKNKV